MATLIHIEGFEHGTVSSSGNGIFESVYGSPTIQSTTKRTGTYAMQFNPTAAVCGVRSYIAAEPTIGVARFYVMFASWPDTNIPIFTFRLAAGLDRSVQFVSSDHTLRLAFDASYGTKTAALSLDTWYRIDVRINVSASPHLGDLQLDGTATDQLSVSSTAGTLPYYVLFSGSISSSHNSYIDDLVVSQTTGDYPIGAGAVIGLLPDGAGTSNPGTYIQDNNSVVVNDSTNPANVELDDIPFSASADYIKQTTVDATLYAEVTFENTTETTIQGVKCFTALAANGTTTNAADVRARDADNQETTIFSGDCSETVKIYKSGMVSTPSGGWTMAQVNALKGRVGYYSVSGAYPIFHALLMQVAYVPATGAAIKKVINE